VSILIEKDLVHLINDLAIDSSSMFLQHAK